MTQAQRYTILISIFILLLNYTSKEVHNAKGMFDNDRINFELEEMLLKSILHFISLDKTPFSNLHLEETLIGEKEAKHPFFIYLMKTEQWLPNVDEIFFFFFPPSKKNVP